MEYVINLDEADDLTPLPKDAIDCNGNVVGEVLQILAYEGLFVGDRIFSNSTEKNIAYFYKQSLTDTVRVMLTTGTHGSIGYIKNAREVYLNERDGIRH